MTPDQLKFRFGLWTWQAVQMLIEHRCGIRMPKRTMGEYLHRWGFTPQKPKKRACEQNLVAVKMWLDEEYPSIVQRAKEEWAEILWRDETGVRSDECAGRKVFLVVDNPREHHVKLVGKWLESLRELVEIFYIPSYSLELNSDEYLNCDLKYRVHSKHPSHDEMDLQGKIISPSETFRKSEQIHSAPNDQVCSMMLLFNCRDNILMQAR